MRPSVIHALSASNVSAGRAATLAHTVHGDPADPITRPSGSSTSIAPTGIANRHQRSAAGDATTVSARSTPATMPCRRSRPKQRAKSPRAMRFAPRTIVSVIRTATCGTPRAPNPSPGGVRARSRAISGAEARAATSIGTAPSPATTRPASAASTTGLTHAPRTTNRSMALLGRRHGGIDPGVSGALVRFAASEGDDGDGSCGDRHGEDAVPPEKAHAGEADGADLEGRDGQQEDAAEEEKEHRDRDGVRRLLRHVKKYSNRPGDPRILLVSCAPEAPCMAETIERVMVITAHPDDSEFGAGGTVARMVKEGREVTYVIVTNGNKGSSDRSMTPERLARIREEEQRNAARTLGLERVEFLGHAAGEVEDTRDLRRDVSRMIRKWRPDLVICQNPHRTYLLGASHRDHRIAGGVTLDCVYPLARDHMAFPELMPTFEPHRVREVYVTQWQDPQLVVDVSDTMDLKPRALACHASQFKNFATVEARVRDRARQLGQAKGYAYAEAFDHIAIPW